MKKELYFFVFISLFLSAGIVSAQVDACRLGSECSGTNYCFDDSALVGFPSKWECNCVLRLNDPESKTVWTQGNEYSDSDYDGYWMGESPSTTCFINANQLDCAPSNTNEYRYLPGYTDADNDSYGVGVLQPKICSGLRLHEFYASVDGDCNDNNKSLYQWLLGYTDADKDGYGVGTPGWVCSGLTLPEGYSTTLGVAGGDCHDNNNSLYQWLGGYVDKDGDGYRGTLDWICSGASLDPAYANNPDCNDTDPLVSPVGPVEGSSRCGDNKDNDCNGKTDCEELACNTIPDLWAPGQKCLYLLGGEGRCCMLSCTSLTLFDKVYMDDDGDGFGSKNEALSSQICPGATKPGYVDNDDDCNDYDASAPKTCADDYPGQCESKSDGCGGTITCYCNSGYGCYSGTCVNIVADCADGSCDGVIGSSSYFLVGLDSSNKQGIAYNIKPSGIHFNKNLSVSFNYNQEEFSTNPKLYKYHDDSFENGLYNISVLEEVNQTIGEDGGTLELGDIKFEIQSEDLIEDINFTLRKVNITLSNNTIAEEDTQPPIEEELKTSLVSMIKSWIMEDNSVNIMSQFISIIRALFSSS